MVDKKGSMKRDRNLKVHYSALCQKPPCREWQPVSVPSVETHRGASVRRSNDHRSPSVDPWLGISGDPMGRLRRSILSLALQNNYNFPFWFRIKPGLVPRRSIREHHDDGAQHTDRWYIYIQMIRVLGAGRGCGLFVAAGLDHPSPPLLECPRSQERRRTASARCRAPCSRWPAVRHDWPLARKMLREAKLFTNAGG